MLQSTYLSTTTIIITLLITLQPPTATSLSVTASFRQKGVTGTVTFSQTSSISPTSISVSLTGLPQGQYPWHIHLYPYRTGTDNPCSPDSVGGHYDPLGASLNPTYVSDCQMNKSLCEVGDISGKFGNLNDSTSSLTLMDDSITLYGLYSIIGRSVVLHTDGSRYICANIGYPDESDDTFVASYVPLRGGSIVGDITIIQYSSNATMVYSRLSNTIPMSLNHNWHVHIDPVAFDCASALGHYNPFNISTGGNYSLLCSGLTPTNCEVGDLSGKGGTLNFTSNLGRNLYTDTDLPYTLMQGISIANRSIVLHEANRGAPRIACGNMIKTSAREASAIFSGQQGITGEIRFKQASPFSNTEVDVSLNGLNGQVEDYYVHETPIGEGDNRCSAQYTGDIWTLDNNYLSGSQLGSLNGSQYNDTFTGANIPLYGRNSIVGRSIVLHHMNGSRWACADIAYTIPIVEATALVNISGQMVLFSFTQPANDPFADTTITIKTVTNMQLTNESSTSTVTIATSTSALTTASQSTVSSQSTIISTGSSSNSMSDSIMTTTTSLLSSSDITYTMSPSKTTVSSSIVSTASSFSISSSVAVIMPFVTSSIMPSLESPTVSNIESVLVSNSPSIHVNPSPIIGSGADPMMRRRKRDSLEENVYELDDNSFIDDEELLELQHYIRKREVVVISWSVKKPNGQQGMSSCDSLEDFLPTRSNSASLCSSGEQLACSSGGLSDKHGPIELDTEKGIRMVLTDPYLPLSGSDSAIGNALLVSSEGSSQYVVISDSNMQQEPIVCDQQPTTTTTTTTLTTVSTSVVIGPTSTSESVLPLPLLYLIIIGVGGALLLAILLVLLIVIIVCCAKRRNKYTFESYAKSKTGGVELGMYKRSNPIYGVASYKVLYHYKPQAEGDLELFEGEMVTLIEAPAGGDWWRGRLEDKEGWFPKSYVNYVEVGVEQKKKMEADIDRVEAVIKAYTIAGSSRMSTIHVDSTPKMVTKFDQPLKEENESTTVEKTYPLPYTPPESGHASPSLSEHKTNLANTLNTTEVTLESPPHSNESLPIVNETASLPSTQSPSPGPESPIPTEDVYIAKYDLVPELDTELQLNAGDRVAIIERADNGWWHGVIGDRHGWIPETFVRPLEEVDDTLKNGSDEEQDNEEEESKFRPRGMTEFHSGTSEEVNVSEYQAITEYVSDTPGDLSFKEGEKVLVYWGNDDGWWFGAAGTVQGWFPGSYVEPIMEEGTPSPSAIHDNVNKEEDKSNADPLDFGNSIAAALKKREQKAAEQERVSTPSVTANTGDLASEISAALGKKTTDQTQSSSEGTLDDQIALKQKQDGDDSALPEDKRNSKGRSDSVDRLGNDIVSMIFSLGSNEELSNVGKTADKPLPKASTVRRPQRKAPMPPTSAARSKSTKVKSKATDTKPQASAVVTPTGTVPMPPPPPPLPTTQPTTKEEKPLKEDNAPPLSNTNNLSIKPVIEVVSSENHSRPNSPASSKRRKPPSPPSHLAAQHGSDSPRSPSPLVTHSRKSPTPTSKNAPEELALNTSSSPVSKENVNSVPNKSPSPLPTNEQRTQAQVQRSASSTSKWQPQLKHKSSGWKPQSKKTKEESAPRREPPKPPANSPPKIRVQKVKRPNKKIPPPPSAPLPPPPPGKSKSSSSIQGPPPVKKVLAGPPPVKKVLGAGSQDPGKRLSKSLSPPPAVTESSIVEDKTSKTLPNKPHIHSLSPTETNLQNKVTPVLKLELKTPAKPTIEVKKDLTVKIENNSNSSNSQSVLTAHVTSKPAVSPKPKTKPAISPKPKSLHPHPIGEVKNGSKTDSNDSKLPTPKPRPAPPTRTSSLPNTPENSPCPSPVPKTKIAPEDTPKISPPPQNVGDTILDSKPSVSEATDSGILDKEKESESSVPVPQTRKKSSTLPPRPAPPRTVTSQVNSQDLSSSTTANAPNPKPRKVSEVGVKIKGLMNPMKTLEARPSRRGRSSEPEDIKPIPKRRTSQDTSEMKGSNIPARPPPPAIARSKSNPDD